MKSAKPSPETMKIACASLLGTDEIPLRETRYYHHQRDNPRMKSSSLFMLNETPYGLSVGCYDIDFAKRLMSALTVETPMLSHSNRRKICQTLEMEVEVSSVGYGRFFCADTLSFREALPPTGHQVERLSSNDLEDFPELKDKFIAYGIWIGNELACHAAIMEFSDSVFPISDIVNVATAPKHRQRGLAKAVVSVCTQDVLSRGRIATYSAEVENLASLRTCMAVGYHPYGESLEILGHVRKPAEG